MGMTTIIMFVPILLGFALFAAIPPDYCYLIALAAAALLFFGIALAPRAASSGSDNWYGGIVPFGGLLAVIGAALTIAAQAARRFIPLETGGYLIALAVTFAIGALVTKRFLWYW